MSEFVRHEPCPKCGSKDNLARYSDGGVHCFGCGFHPRVNKSPYLNKENEFILQNKQLRLTQLETLVQSSLSGMSVNWLSSYGILVPEALRRGCRGDVKESGSLYFTWYSDNGELILAQERPIS